LFKKVILLVSTDSHLASAEYLLNSESISEDDDFVVEVIAKVIAVSVCSLEFGQGR
jgi:hypothetical protein